MQFIDIILFALVAGFMVFRLWGVLGRRDGHEGGFHDRFRRDQNRDQNEDADNIVPFPDDASPTPENPADDTIGPARPEVGPAWDATKDSIDPLTKGLADIQDADPDFVPSEFLSGARIAFEMILASFAAGETAALKPLLGDDVFGNFQRAIRDREAAGETLEESLVGIKSADIVEAWMESKIAYVTVKFISEQISATRSENGDIVDGDPEKIMELTDFWTFAHSTRTRDPNWSLVETRSLD